MHYTHYTCPIGTIRLRACDAGLIAVDHVNQQDTTDDGWIEDATHPVLQQAVRELDDYFAGNRRDFTVLLAPHGTDFQQNVWQALQTIPFGETCSYSDIAQQIGKPDAVRAVGAANGQNPLSIFIPCHRVIGKSGKLTGYAGGLEVKRILLAHETEFLFPPASAGGSDQ